MFRSIWKSYYSLAERLHEEERSWTSRNKKYSIFWITDFTSFQVIVVHVTSQVSKRIIQGAQTIFSFYTQKPNAISKGSRWMSIHVKLPAQAWSNWFPWFTHTTKIHIRSRVLSKQVFGNLHLKVWTKLVTDVTIGLNCLLLSIVPVDMIWLIFQIVVSSILLCVKYWQPILKKMRNSQNQFKKIGRRNQNRYIGIGSYINAATELWGNWTRMFSWFETNMLWSFKSKAYNSSLLLMLWSLSSSVK